jgi:hypothetical protein
MQQNIPMTRPNVAPGLTVAEGARIAGNLEYSSTYDLDIPASAVAGQVTRVQPEVSEGQAKAAPTPAQEAGKWALDLLRAIVTLVLFGLLLGWLAPVFLKTASSKLQTQTWPSLGWGAIAWAAFFFALLLIVIIMIAGGIIFGVLTLGGVSGAIIWLGILSLFALIVIFVLATPMYLRSSSVRRLASGSSARPILPWPREVLADDPGVTGDRHRHSRCSFPLLPLGFFGWLLNFAVVLFGLGALWLWGRERLSRQPAG